MQSGQVFMSAFRADLAVHLRQARSVTHETAGFRHLARLSLRSADQVSAPLIRDLALAPVMRQPSFSDVSRISGHFDAAGLLPRGLVHMEGASGQRPNAASLAALQYLQPLSSFSIVSQTKPTASARRLWERAWALPRCWLRAPPATAGRSRADLPARL